MALMPMDAAIGGGAIAEVRFFQAFDFEKFQRDDGKEHVHVDVRDDGFWRDGGMRGEIAGAEKAFFFRGDQNKEERAAQLFGMGFEAGGDVQEDGTARGVVHGAVVDAVAVDGLADAEVVEWAERTTIFILETGSEPGSLATRLADSSSLERTGRAPGARQEERNVGEVCDLWRGRRFQRRCAPSPAKSFSAEAGLKVSASLRPSVSLNSAPARSMEG